MRWRGYQEYIQCKKGYLGLIPIAWMGLPLKRWVATKITDGPHETPDLIDEGIDFISAEAISSGRINFDSRRGFISDELHLRYCKKCHPEKGDIFFCKSGATTGKIAIVTDDKEFSVWSPLAQVRATTSRILPRFLFFSLQSEYVQNQVKSTWSAGTQPNISMGDIERLFVVAPSLKEQQTIATFLDRETERIDSLIARKQRQIELLNEKRGALISRAVTKGLNPEVKMKDSGVDWLGEIPEQWAVSRLKNLGAIRYGLGEPPEYRDEGLPFIRATDIKQGKIDLEKVKKVSPEDIPWNRNPLLQHNEILVVRSGAYTGDSAIVTSDVSGCIAGYDMVLTLKKANARFVAWVLLSKYVLQGQVYLERLRAAQPHLNAEELGGFVILLPQLPEQCTIADFLDREISEMEQLAAKVELSIKILREYRTALITAAVTGKIDVRQEATHARTAH